MAVSLTRTDRTPKVVHQRCNPAAAFSALAAEAGSNVTKPVMSFSTRMYFVSSSSGESCRPCLILSSVPGCSQLRYSLAPCPCLTGTCVSCCTFTIPVPMYRCSKCKHELISVPLVVSPNGRGTFPVYCETQRGGHIRLHTFTPELSRSPMPASLRTRQDRWTQIKKRENRVVLCASWMVTIRGVSMTVTRYILSNIVHAYISVVNPRGYPWMSQTPQHSTDSFPATRRVTCDGL